MTRRDENLVKRALRAGTKDPIIGYLGFGIGIVLCAAALMGTLAVLELNTRSNGDYLTLSKEAAAGPGRAFTPAEIDELAATPGVGRVIPIEKNEFNIYGYVEVPNAKYGTSMFFEAVPTEYLDAPTNFVWHRDTDVVPLLLSEDFLFLYNATFGPAYGLPNIKPELLPVLNIQLQLYGRNQMVQLPAKIVGVTKRIQSIMVPLDFVRAMNQRIGEASRIGTGPNKVLLRVGDRASGQLNDLIKAKNYKSTGDALRHGPLVTLASLVISALIGVGLCFVLLALGQILVSIHLSLFQSAGIAGALVGWGYTPAVIRQIRGRDFMGRLGLIVGLSLMVEAVLFGVLTTYIDGVSPWPLVGAVGLSLLCGVVAFLLAAARIRRPVEA